jgi:hypothetical protein
MIITVTYQVCMLYLVSVSDTYQINYKYFGSRL